MPTPETALAQGGASLLVRVAAWIAFRTGRGVITGGLHRWAAKRLPSPDGRLSVEARSDTTNRREWRIYNDYAHGVLIIHNLNVFDVELGRAKISAESPWGLVQGEVDAGLVPRVGSLKIAARFPYGPTFAKRVADAGTNATVSMTVRVEAVQIVGPWRERAYAGIKPDTDAALRSEIG